MSEERRCPIVGYLVVTRDLEPSYPGYRRVNTRYQGVARVPSIVDPDRPTEHPAEWDAMRQYVFGKYKDIETGLIPSLEKSRKLLSLFASSPREFELLFVSDSDAFDPPAGALPQELGYDIAGVTSGYDSLLDDIPEGAGCRAFVPHLNENGLLPTRSLAEQFLDACIAEGESDPDWEFPFTYSIIKVWRVR